MQAKLGEAKNFCNGIHIHDSIIQKIINEIDSGASPEESIRLTGRKLGLKEPVKSCLLNLADLTEELIYNPDITRHLVEKLLEIGFPLSFINKYIIYPSGRPRTSMPFLKIPQIPCQTALDNAMILKGNSENHVLIQSDWINKTVELKQPVMIPVIRYVAGMRRQTLHYYNLENTGNPYCGTFYYFEPNSNIFLNAHHILITPNKITGMYYLSQNWDVVMKILEDPQLATNPAWLGLPYNLLGEDILTHLLTDPDLSNFRLEHSEEINIALSPQEVSRIFHARISDYNITLLLYLDKVFPSITKKYSLDAYLHSFKTMINGTFDFNEYHRGMYAFEDKFDQPLCQLAHKLQYDVIILTTMTGGTRIVTEVFDIRNREHSYNSLNRIDYTSSCFEILKDLGSHPRTLGID